MADHQWLLQVRILRERQHPAQHRILQHEVVLERAEQMQGRDRAQRPRQGLVRLLHRLVQRAILVTRSGS